MTLELKLGQRYVCRNGELTSPLERSSGTSTELTNRYPFLDRAHGTVYASTGQYNSENKKKSQFDLVREYVPLPDVLARDEASEIIWA